MLKHRWLALSVIAATAGATLIAATMSGRDAAPERAAPAPANSGVTTETPEATALLAEDWPNLFGPRHDSRSAGAVSVAWPEDGPPELWRIPIGTGYSSPIVVGERVVLLHRVAAEEVVSCLDAATASPLWEFRYPTSFVCGSHYTNGPYSTPASNGECVVTLGAQGQLHCIDLQTGDVIWQRDTAAEFETPGDVFGAGHSPLIRGDTVILNIGGAVADAGIIAFDLADGRIRWRATSHGPSYATPAPARIHQRERLLVLTKIGLVLLDPENGRVLDEFAYSSSVPDGYNAVTPAVWEDLVFVSVFGEGSVCLRVQADDRFTEVWEDRRTLTSQYNPILIDEGFLYGLHALDKSFRCVDLATGELQWRHKSALARSTHLIAGDQIVLFGEYGELGVIDLDPTACTERALTAGSLFDGERCFSAPAISRGRLLLRNERELACFDVGP
jgi:outer membrane protein assembly factor BamB